MSNNTNNDANSASSAKPAATTSSGSPIRNRPANLQINTLQDAVDQPGAMPLPNFASTPHVNSTPPLHPQPALATPGPRRSPANTSTNRNNSMTEAGSGEPLFGMMPSMNSFTSTGTGGRSLISPSGGGGGLNNSIGGAADRAAAMLRVPSTPGGRSVSPLPQRPAQRSTIGGYSSTALRSVVSSPSLSRNKSNVTFDSMNDLAAAGMSHNASMVLNSPSSMPRHSSQQWSQSGPIFGSGALGGSHQHAVQPGSVAALALGDVLEDPNTMIQPPPGLSPVARAKHANAGGGGSEQQQQQFLNLIQQQQQQQDQQQRGASIVSSVGGASSTVVSPPPRAAGAAAGGGGGAAVTLLVEDPPKAPPSVSDEDDGSVPPPGARKPSKDPEEQLNMTAEGDATAPPSPSGPRARGIAAFSDKDDNSPLQATCNEFSRTEMLGEQSQKSAAGQDQERSSPVTPSRTESAKNAMQQQQLYTPEEQKQPGAEALDQMFQPVDQHDGGGAEGDGDAEDEDDDFVESELLLTRLWFDTTDTASMCQTDTMSPPVGSLTKFPGSNDALDEQQQSQQQQQSRQQQQQPPAGTETQPGSTASSPLAHSAGSPTENSPLISMEPTSGSGSPNSQHQQQQHGAGGVKPHPHLLQPAVDVKQLRRGNWLPGNSNMEHMGTSSTTHPLANSSFGASGSNNPSNNPSQSQRRQSEDNAAATATAATAAAAGKAPGSGPGSARAVSVANTDVAASATEARYMVVDMEAEYHRYGRKRQFERAMSMRQGSVQHLSGLTTPGQQSFGWKSGEGSAAGSGCHNPSSTAAAPEAAAAAAETNSATESPSQQHQQHQEGGAGGSSNNSNPFQGFSHGSLRSEAEKLLSKDYVESEDDGDTSEDPESRHSSRHGSRRLVKSSACSGPVATDNAAAAAAAGDPAEGSGGMPESSSKTASFRAGGGGQQQQQQQPDGTWSPGDSVNEKISSAGGGAADTPPTGAGSKSNSMRKVDFLENGMDDRPGATPGSDGGAGGMRTPMMLSHSFRTKHLAGVPEQADPDDDGGCGCTEAQIVRFADQHDIEALDFGQHLARCSICQRRPAAFICLHDLKAACPSHVEALAQQRPEERTLFVNTLDIATAYDRIFWCERCKSFTWKYTDPYTEFIDRIVRTRKPYLAEPSTDVFVQHYQIRDRGAAAQWKPVSGSGKYTPSPPSPSPNRDGGSAATGSAANKAAASALPGQPLQRLCVTMTSTQGWRSTQEDAEVVFRVTTKSLQLPDWISSCAPATEYVVIAVFDGHGGDSVAKIAAHNIEHHFRIALHNEIIGLRNAKQNEMTRSESLRSVGTLESPARDAAMRAEAGDSLSNTPQAAQTTTSADSMGAPSQSFPTTPSLTAANPPTAANAGAGGAASSSSSCCCMDPPPLTDGESKRRHGFFQKVLSSTLLSLDTAIQNTPEHSNDYLYGMVGATACVVVITEEDIVCASAGDSRAVLWNKKRRTAIALSEDHKLSVPAERARVEQAGYSIVNERIEGFLAVPRALGDFDFKMNGSAGPEEQAVTAYPDVRLVPRSFLRGSGGGIGGGGAGVTSASSSITSAERAVSAAASNTLLLDQQPAAAPGPHTVVNEQRENSKFFTMAAQPPEDWMVLVACDGVWDVLSNEEACVVADKVFDEEVALAYAAHRRRVCGLGEHSSFHSDLSQFSAFHSHATTEPTSSSANKDKDADNAPSGAASATGTSTPPPPAPPITSKSVAGTGISALRSLTSKSGSLENAAAEGDDNDVADSSAPLISLSATEDAPAADGGAKQQNSSATASAAGGGKSEAFPASWYTAALYSNAINDALGDAVCGILREAISKDLDEDSGKGGDNCSCIACKLCTTA